MRRLLLIILALTVAGCDAGERDSLDDFEARWHEAVNHREGDDLFAMLDSSSQWRIRHDLEVMRGLEPGAQQAVIAQLGGVRVENLHELTPQRYFARLWDLATDGQRPTMAVEASGDDSGYMILTLGRDRTLRVRLLREAGKWVWQLPREGIQPGAVGGGGSD